jgi:L-amino acid N-acyltransferase YncA
MEYRLRVPTQDDWSAIFQVAMQAVPDAEAENREWWENRQAIDEREQQRRHTVVEDETGAVVGYGAVEEGPEDGLFRMFLVASPDRVKRGLGDDLYGHLMSVLDELDARIVWIREEARDPIVAYFLGKGFQERARFMLDNGREAIVLYRVLST